MAALIAVLLFVSSSCGAILHSDFRIHVVTSQYGIGYGIGFDTVMADSLQRAFGIVYGIAVGIGVGISCRNRYFLFVMCYLPCAN